MYYRSSNRYNVGVWHFQGIESCGCWCWYWCCWCCGSQPRVLLSKTIWLSTLGRLRLEETLLGVTAEWILGSKRRPSETIHMGHLTSNRAIYVPFSHNKWRSRKCLCMQIIANACGGWGPAVPEIAHCLSSQCFQDSSKILLRLFSTVLPRCLPAFLRSYLAAWFRHFSTLSSNSSICSSVTGKLSRAGWGVPWMDTWTIMDYYAK